MTQWALSRKENPTIHDIHRHDSEWVVAWSPPRVRIWRGLGDHLQIWTSSCSPQLCRGRVGECGSCDESSCWHCPLSHTHTLHMRASLKLRCSASCELLDLKEIFNAVLTIYNFMVLLMTFQNPFVLGWKAAISNILICHFHQNILNSCLQYHQGWEGELDDDTCQSRPGHLLRCQQPPLEFV